MKKILIFIAALFVLAGCTQEKLVTLVNPIDLDRPDEPVLLERDQLEQITGDLSPGQFILATDQDGNNVPNQLDDLDGDGKWDKVAMVYSFHANQTVSLSITVIEEKPEFLFRTNIRFANYEPPNEEYETGERLQTPLNTITQKNFQMEGPGWENDIVGFRNYFDQRNGMDIFGKKTSEMVLDSCGINEDYHSMQSWGMDVLKVGTSLGAGSIGMFKDGELFRIGDSGTGTFKIVTEGPVRSVFKFTFNDWVCGDQLFNIVHYVTIWAGSYGYDNTVVIKDKEGTLISGLVNMHTDTLFVNEFEDYVSLATHGPQAELDKYLGMGLLIPAELYQGHGEAPESGDGITQTCYGKIRMEPDQMVTFHFLTGWEDQDSKFTELDEFLKLLEFDAKRRSNPIQVSF
ncbi:MAG: DUF4861 family protein [Bacteroidales bacterium]|nr:DUF4861 family protein [Bacteroidales bacterium]